MIKCPVCQHLNEDFNSKCEVCGADLFSFEEENVFQDSPVHPEKNYLDDADDVDSLISPTEAMVVFGVNAFILIISLFSSTDSYRSPERIAWFLFGFTALYSFHNYLKMPEEVKIKIDEKLKTVDDDLMAKTVAALTAIRGGCFTAIILLILSILGFYAYEADYFGFTFPPSMGFWEYIFTAYFWLLLIWILLFLPFYIAKHFFKNKINSKIYNFMFNIGKLSLLYFPFFTVAIALFIAIVED
jgi:glycosyltransferase involved in cell wall biosynthesis